MEGMESVTLFSATEEHAEGALTLPVSRSRQVLDLATMTRTTLVAKHERKAIHAGP